jgi:serine/threonine protein kinase
MDSYTPGDNIGTGSFGRVFLAYHKKEKKNYVIKEIKTKDISDKDKENIENEVKLL